MVARVVDIPCGISVTDTMSTVYGDKLVCHEGNYALVNVLRGARVEDAHAAR